MKDNNTLYWVCKDGDTPISSANMSSTDKTNTLGYNPTKTPTLNNSPT